MNTVLFILYATVSMLGSSTAGKTDRTTTMHTVVTDDDDPVNWPVEKFVKTQKQIMASILKTAMPAMMDMSSRLSAKCTRDLMMLGIGLRQFKDWSFRMFDASAKLHPGIMEGTIFGMGSYDECVDIVVANQEIPFEERFRGQYCVVDLRPPNSMLQPHDVIANLSGIKDYKSTVFSLLSLHAGYQGRFKMKFSICVPSTCSKNDVQSLADKTVMPLGWSPSVMNCEVKGPLEMSTKQIIICCILLSLAMLIVMGTMVGALELSFSDPKLKSEVSWKKKVIDVLRELSVYTNTKEFLKVPDYTGKLDALAGIRFFSMSWTILGHSYYIPEQEHYYFLFKDSITLSVSQNEFFFLVITNMTMSIDTFFLVTAFFTTYNSLRAMKKDDGKLPAFRFIVRRITRFLPTQFLVIGIVMLMPLFGSGPLWKSSWQKKTKNCENLWWTNLLFIQNYFNWHDTCLFHTWYIAVSMQMHIITFFLLILLYRKPILGILANVGLITAGCIAVALVTLYADYPATFDAHISAMGAQESFARNVYTQVYSHIGSYCVGVLLAYFITKYPDKKLNNKTWRTFTWISASAAAVASVYGVYAFTDYSWASQPPFGRVFYAGMYRTVFGICVAWVIFDCISYPKGIVNSILSWKPFIYLDSLALLVYLVHPIVIAYQHARARTLLNTDVIDMVYFYIGNMVLTYMVAFILHVTIERSLNAFDKALYRKNNQNKPDVESPEKTVTIQEFATASRGL